MGGKSGVRIGVDMDDTFFPFVGGLVEWHNRAYGTDWTIGQFNTYKFSQVPGFPVNAEERVREYLESDFHWNLAPLEGAVEGIRELASRNELFLMTSRNGKYRDRTLEYINRQFGDGVFKEHFFTYNHYTKDGIGTKAEMCREENIGIVIEDTVENAQELCNGRVTTIMIDWPWNREFRNSKAFRVRGWI